ncbi:DPP IV N-terminal domain-containing protein [Hankyongella ginsenosidimutans]|uniref:DPP IV N-terminal domain-containing protein n=1 Tax=Hankyongella ginsenosidimutans TaxID=1763828 RepID=UPI001FE28A29|nr:DPP IV N-terminal domain-containing protein [Hankyongella ginsenosidimutans]
MRARTRLVAGVILLLVAAPAHAAPKKFDSLDVFNLEWADDPQVSPDGSSIVYVRRGYDIMSDRARGNLWQVNTRTGAHEPLLSGTASYSQPRWSPDGTRLAYVTASDGGAQIYVRWVASGHTARITNMQEGPQNIRWSPDGKQIAFLADVPRESKPLASLPKPPEGAKWAPPLKVIDQTVFRADGGGYLEPTTTQLFVVPADGGTPRQVTTADYDHEGAPNWSPDGKAIILAANPEARTKEIPGNSDIFAVDVASGTETKLTSRFGPDQQPALSPDGKLIAYVGYDDKYQGYQNAVLSIMNADGSNPAP